MSGTLNQYEQHREAQLEAGWANGTGSPDSWQWIGRIPNPWILPEGKLYDANCGFGERIRDQITWSAERKGVFKMLDMGITESKTNELHLNAICAHQTQQQLGI